MASDMKALEADQSLPLADELRQIAEAIGNSPLTQMAENALNSNPLRQVIPVDWAEVVRALRTVWLYQVSRPENAIAKLVDLNLRAWQSTLGIWNDAALCWLGLESSTPQRGAKEDKRFSAPEWQSNPVYRTLKQLYLLASEWLLELAEEVGPITSAERQWLTFHLRQFVDAVSPALSPVSNPVALRRALETGGVSLTDGLRNLMSDLRQGSSRWSMLLHSSRVTI
jgi:polyhydroxyalkanoate synthase